MAENLAPAGLWASCMRSQTVPGGVEAAQVWPCGSAEWSGRSQVWFGCQSENFYAICFPTSEKLCKFARMKAKVFFLTAVAAVTLLSCGPTESDNAAELVAQIEQLYADGKYQTVLDSITSLRQRYPREVEARRRVLPIWQDASLRIAQADIARTDSALQATIAEMEAAKTIRERNFIGIRRDSLQVRYDVLVGTVRVIHRRQQEK